MTVAAMGRLAYKHVLSSFNEELYIKLGLDLTAPIKVYATINERCNYRCRYCDYWRMKEYADELTIDEWKAALGSLKAFIGRYHIEFSGGEPFIKKGFLDLLAWCSEQGIDFGVTTNGSGMTPKGTPRFVATRPFNVNISIDSHESEVHDYSRGVDGSLAHLRGAVGRLREEQQRQGIRFPITVKPTVTSLNFRHLPELARWAIRDMGATMVNFQAVDRWTQETRDELWIEETEHGELDRTIAALVEMKREGFPIMNSEETLLLWPKHFREEKAPPEAMPCRVGLRNFFIRTNGDVEVCWHWPIIGNIKRQSAREIWESAEARQRRKETIACERLCLFSCLSNNTFSNKLRTGIALLRDRSGDFIDKDREPATLGKG
jgi:radical SAM protein with 4Fe4S-binding SPASM domain